MSLFPALLLHASPCFSCHRDGLWLRLAGISRPSLWWCDVCCQWVKAFTHLHFTAPVMFIASIRAEEKNDLFDLIHFFLAGQLQFYFIFSFDRSQHESSLETNHLRQGIWCWPYLQSKDVIQISKKHKAQGTDLCMKGIRSDLCVVGGSGQLCTSKGVCTEWHQSFTCNRKWGKQPFFHGIVLFCKRVCWQHCFSVKDILRVRCEKYGPLRREIKWIF